MAVISFMIQAPGGVIFAQLACPLKDITICLLTHLFTNIAYYQTLDYAGKACQGQTL
jgi:hypothetical protein